jgi:hypothetical protein
MHACLVPKGLHDNRTFRDEHGQQQPPPLGLRRSATAASSTSARAVSLIVTAPTTVIIADGEPRVQCRHVLAQMRALFECQTAIYTRMGTLT